MAPLATYREASAPGRPPTSPRRCGASGSTRRSTTGSCCPTAASTWCCSRPRARRGRPRGRAEHLRLPGRDQDRRAAPARRRHPGAARRRRRRAGRPDRRARGPGRPARRRRRAGGARGRRRGARRRAPGHRRGPRPPARRARRARRPGRATPARAAGPHPGRESGTHEGGREVRSPIGFQALDLCHLDDQGRRSGEQRSVMRVWFRFRSTSGGRFAPFEERVRFSCSA